MPDRRRKASGFSTAVGILRTCEGLELSSYQRSLHSILVMRLGEANTQADCPQPKNRLLKLTRYRLLV